MNQKKTRSESPTESHRPPSSPILPPRQRASSSNPAPDRSVYFAEASGKIVDYIRYSEQQVVEIRFTDGTFLYIEPRPYVEFRVRYLKTRGGNIRTIRDYGVLPERIGSQPG